MKRIGKVILLTCIFVITLCACHNAPNARKAGSEGTFSDYSEKGIHVIYDDATEMFSRVKASKGHVVYSVLKDNQEIFYETSDEQNFCSSVIYEIDSATTDVLDYSIGDDGCTFFIVLEALDNEENIYLKKRTTEGDMVTIRHLNDFHRGAEDDCYLWRVLIKPDGSLLVHSNYAYLLLDEAGNVIKEDCWGENEVFAFAYIDENTLLLYRSVDYKMTFYYVDINTGNQIECSNLPEWQNPVVIKNSNESVCINTASCLCRYDFKTQKTESLIQWADFGVVGDNIWYIYEQNDEIHCILYENSVLYDRTFELSETGEAKTEIRMGCFGETTQLREAVAAFNKENSEYVVVIEDYGDGEQEAVNRLYNEVLTEKGPDIIRFSSEYIIDKKLGQTGMLEDLAPYLQKSTVIQRENIVDSLYHAMLVDDRLYMLPTNFMIGALATKEKWCGEDRVFTCEEMLQAIETCEMQAMMSREELLRYGGLFEEYSTESDDVRLKEYLEIADKLSETVYYQPEEALRQGGKIPFESIILSDMEDYLYLMSAWGEDAAITGFPEAEGNGMAFLPINCFGINSKSSHKEEAWGFLESFFTQEWQDNITPNWDFSACKEVLEQQLAAAMKTEYYDDEEGIRHEIPILDYELDGEMINVYAAGEEDVARVKEMIEGVKVINRGEPSFVDIIQEEALYYFDRKKDIDEIIGIIRSRINIYRQENEI